MNEKDPIKLAIDALAAARDEYWDDNHSHMSEGDFENHWLVMDIDRSLKALRALQSQPAHNPRQPIETAPLGESGKPETYILISKQEQGTTLVATGYRNIHGAYEWFGGGMRGITHWMPLPAAPDLNGE